MHRQSCIENEFYSFQQIFLNVTKENQKASQVAMKTNYFPALFCQAKSLPGSSQNIRINEPRIFQALMKPGRKAVVRASHR